MRILPLAVLALPVALAACGPSIVPGINPMHYGSNEARQIVGGVDTPVVVIGNPFPGTDKAQMAAVVAEALHNAAPMVQTRFVPADAAAAAKAPGSVVIALNPAGNVNAGNLCGVADLPTDPARRPILAEAAFCSPGARTTSMGWLYKVEGINDPSFAELIGNTVSTLFPTYFCRDPLCF